MKLLLTATPALLLAGLLAFMVFAANDQRGFREALNRVSPSQRIIFASEKEADIGPDRKDGDRGVFFIPNDTRQWWQFWRPAYRPVYWSVSRRA